VLPLNPQVSRLGPLRSRHSRRRRNSAGRHYLRRYGRVGCDGSFQVPRLRVFEIRSSIALPRRPLVPDGVGFRFEGLEQAAESLRRRLRPAALDGFAPPAGPRTVITLDERLEQIGCPDGLGIAQCGEGFPDVAQRQELEPLLRVVACRVVEIDRGCACDLRPNVPRGISDREQGFPTVLGAVVQGSRQRRARGCQRGERAGVRRETDASTAAPVREALTTWVNEMATIEVEAKAIPAVFRGTSRYPGLLQDDRSSPRPARPSRTSKAFACQHHDQR
jgi:hypothetical protein